MRSAWVLSTVTTVFLALSSSSLCSAHSTDDGWSALRKNKEADAIAQFRSALAQNPRDVRAALGLSYAYGMLQNSKDSWNAFRTALTSAPDGAPYLYASILTDRFTSQVYDPSSGILELLGDAIKRPDSLGILQAMALEQMGMIAERRGRIDEARSLYRRIGAVRTWRLAGPFDNTSASGFDRSFPPEYQDSATATFNGASGAIVRWNEPKVFRNDGWIDMARYFPTNRGVFYGITYTFAPKRMRAQLRLGTSGAFKLFLNDSVVNESIDEHNNDVDTYVAEVWLESGWNRILVKCCNSELTSCNFFLRITDAAGIPVPDLQFSTSSFPANKGKAEAVRIDNPYTAWFRRAIERDPNALENYLLLAECHLRNDQAIDAELVLRNALERAPDCIPVLTLLLEAYQRGGKTDEYATTMERIALLRPDLPLPLGYKFQTALAADRLEEAAQTLDGLSRIIPGTVSFYDNALSLARRRNRIADMNELYVRAFEDHPENVNYAAMNATMALQTPQRHAAAIAIIQRHLSFAYTEQGLLILANLQRDAGRLDEWEGTFKKLFDLSPAAPGYHVVMSDVYSARKQYDQALAHIKQALAISPGASVLWARAGALDRTLYDSAGAFMSFTQALECDPANFDAREALRDVTGAASPFSIMPSANIDSIIASSPMAAEAPDAAAVYLFDDLRRVVYDGSRAEVLRETVIKILTTEGIDAFKEYRLPFSGDGSLIIEKAIVRKADGREIPADHNSGLLVFKGLVPGDYLIIRTRSRESRSGRLAKYFWDSYDFNAFYPVLLSRYSILVPVGTSFKWQTDNWSSDPRITPTPFGTLYTWTNRNEPAIEYEEGMPDYGSIGKQLQVSSVDSWRDLISWYYDIARTKTRSSYEIASLMKDLLPKDASEADVIKAVYQYITSEIRYSSVPFRQSGIVPQKARDVLVTRIGDCKDVATLCIAMLAERNIEAYHVLLRTNTSPLFRTPLPSIPFDHCIVAIMSKKGLMYMDLTADNIPVGSLPFGDVDGLALMIKPGEAEPFRLGKSDFPANNIQVTTAMNLLDDGSAHFTQTFTHTGARTQLYRSAWKGKSRREQEKQIVEMLAQDYPDVSLEAFDIRNLDSLTQNLTYTLTYLAPTYVTEAGDFLFFRVPWFGEFHPDGALSYEKREYPYEFSNYQDTVAERITIRLPKGYTPSGLKPVNSFIPDAAEYDVRNDLRGSDLVLNRRTVFKRNYVMPEEYTSYKTFYNQCVKNDRRHMLLVPRGTTVRPPSRP